MTNEKVFSYLRTSTQDQELGIEKQRRKIRELADTENYSIEKEFENQISGSKGSGQGEASSSISRSEQIKVNTAFQQAVETVRESGKDLNRKEHFEEVEKLTNGYYNVLDSQMKDKAGDNK